jgi:phage terminase small subunit
MTTKLTAKQQAFVEQYLIDLNGAEAARRLGLSAKTAKYTARRWMGMPQVQAAINLAINARAQRTQIAADVVLEALVRNALKAEAAGEHAAATTAWAWVGKHLKLFTEKHEHGGIGGGPVQFVLSDKEADL